MKKINLGKVDLTVYDGPIGIRASGGADSSILLYYLALHHDGPIYVYNLSEEINEYLEEGHMIRVVDKIRELTSNVNIIIKHFRVPAKSIDILLDITITNSIKDNVSMLYSGITKRPPPEIENLFKQDINEPDITNFRDPDLKVPTLYDKTYMPFANLNKKDISDFYTKAGVMDTLFPVTFSCVSDLRTHCKECWWCEERIWAFGKV
jgi:hypothetical protein